MSPGLTYPGVSVIFFCHDGKGNYLLSKRGVNCRDEHGRWDPGGGGIDFGEKVEDVLKREIKEEYSTEVLEAEFLGFRDVHRQLNGKKTHWFALDYKVLVDRKKAKNGEPHKFDEIGWFTINKLPSPLHSQFLFALEKYKDRL